jgi:hypothetical protein
LVPVLFTFYIQGVLILKKKFRRQRVNTSFEFFSLSRLGLSILLPAFPRMRDTYCNIY